MTAHCPNCGFTQWTLDDEEYAAFVEQIDHPPPPTPALTRALLHWEDALGRSDLVTVTLSVEDWQLVTSAVFVKSLEFAEGTLAERFWLDLYEKLQSFNQ